MGLHPFVVSLSNHGRMKVWLEYLQPFVRHYTSLEVESNYTLPLNLKKSEEWRLDAYIPDKQVRRFLEK